MALAERPRLFVRKTFIDFAAADEEEDFPSGSARLMRRCCSDTEVDYSFGAGRELGKTPSVASTAPSMTYEKSEADERRRLEEHERCCERVEAVSYSPASSDDKVIRPDDRAFSMPNQNFFFHQNRFGGIHRVAGVAAHHPIPIGVGWWSPAYALVQPQWVLGYQHPCEAAQAAAIKRLEDKNIAEFREAYDNAMRKRLDLRQGSNVEAAPQYPAGRSYEAVAARALAEIKEQLSRRACVSSIVSWRRRYESILGPLRCFAENYPEHFKVITCRDKRYFYIVETKAYLEAFEGVPTRELRCQDRRGWPAPSDSSAGCRQATHEARDLTNSAESDCIPSQRKADACGQQAETLRARPVPPPPAAAPLLILPVSHGVVAAPPLLSPSRMEQKEEEPARTLPTPPTQHTSQHVECLEGCKEAAAKEAADAKEEVQASAMEASDAEDARQRLKMERRLRHQKQHEEHQRKQKERLQTPPSPPSPQQQEPTQPEEQRQPQQQPQPEALLQPQVLPSQSPSHPPAVRRDGAARKAERPKAKPNRKTTTGRSCTKKALPCADDDDACLLEASTLYSSSGSKPSILYTKRSYILYGLIALMLGLALRSSIGYGGTTASSILTGSATPSWRPSSVNYRRPQRRYYRSI